MKMTGNTILITGGGSGIGRALAESFHKLGNQVVIAGRRESVLKETAAANPGMESLTLDATSLDSIRSAAEELRRRFPKLNVVLNNAGIMRPENLLDPASTFDTAEQTITTNLLSPMWMTGVLLPQLLEQPSATIMTVTSGLAFTPMAMTPTYCATKAAIHSWTQSLRFQLRDTNIEVLELVPPYVQTELMGSQQATDPRAMPLADFISEVMEILANQPDAKEICVQRVYPLRYAAEQGQEKYEQFVAQFNAQMAADPH